jgi:SAM-dependent methyltransferase
VTTGHLYERIGEGYARHRRSDPRIVAQIDRALGDARSVVNVGAGTGSYEPDGRRVVAVEPSAVMLAQRADHAAPAVRGIAEALPIADQAVDATLAVLTLHHWGDLHAGVRELQRVSRRQVVLHFVPGQPFWLADEYLQDVRDLETAGIPTVEDVADLLGAARVEVVPVPPDCVDGFFSAFWRRPHAYLDPAVRASISYLAQLEPDTLAPGLERLRADLDSGAWARRHADMLAQDEFDGGYRLLVAD